MLFEGIPWFEAMYRRLDLLKYKFNYRQLFLSDDRKKVIESDIMAYNARQDLYEHGDSKKHLKTLRRALAIDPRNASAIAYSVFHGDDALVDDVVDHCSNRGLMSSISKWEQAIMWFAMARYQERKAHYDRAWPCYEHGNMVIKQLYPFDPSHLEHLVEKFIRNLDRRMIHGMHGNMSRKPIFIVGLPRSGTTILEQMLGGHPDIHPMGELSHLQDTLRDIEIKLPFEKSAMSRVGNSYMRRALFRDPRILLHKRFVDKMPDNWQTTGIMAMALPNCKILWLQRDPIDNLISAWREPLWQHGWATDLEWMARKWAAKENALEHFRYAVPKSTLKVVQYEDMVTAPENFMRSVLDHLELPWDDRVLHPEAVHRRVETASVLQARQPVHSRSVSRWSTIYAAQLAPLQDLVGDPAKIQALIDTTTTQTAA